jgi:hypothetical protein
MKYVFELAHASDSHVRPRRSISHEERLQSRRNGCGDQGGLGAHAEIGTQTWTVGVPILLEELAAIELSKNSGA